MKSRVLAIGLVIVGLLAIAAGLGLRVFTTEDEGHHDGRPPTFALESALGVDELVVERLGDGSVISVGIERATQPVTDFDDVHGAEMHVYIVGDDLLWFQHVDPEMLPDGSSAPVEVISGENLRVVTQSAPTGGTGLLELGVDVELGGSPINIDQNIATDDVWVDGDLTITREGFDFVLSEPWEGDDYHGAPALLTLFRAEDLAFVHGHASIPESDRFRFNLDLPGRGEYLAALQFNRGGVPVTALFRFEL